MAALVGMSVAVGCDGKGFDPTKDPPKMQAVQGASLVENRSVLTACLNGSLTEPPGAKDLALIFGPPGTDLTKDLTQNGVPDEYDALACAETFGLKAATGSNGDSRNSILETVTRANLSAGARDAARFLQGLFYWSGFMGVAYGCRGNLKGDPLSVFQLTDPFDLCEQGGYVDCLERAEKSWTAMEHVEEFRYVVMRSPSVRVCAIENGHVNGAYDAEALRWLAASASALRSGFLFLFAHINFTVPLEETTLALNGGARFPTKDRSLTAAEWLNLVDQFQPLLILLFHAPLYEDNREHLRVSKGEVVRALTWLADDPYAPPIPKEGRIQPSLGVPLRWDDRNSNAVLDGCDRLMVRLGPVIAAVIPNADGSPTDGCEESAPEGALQLPRVFRGKVIDYAALWRGTRVLATALIDNLGRAEAPLLTADHLNAVLTPLGMGPLSDIVRLNPAVLFDEGLSIFAPAVDSSRHFMIEAEINVDVSADPETRADLAEPLGQITESDPFIYNAKRKHSASITRGDGPHFGGAVPADHISVNEARLDLDGATEKNTFRVKRGGGFLPYVRFADPTLGGLIRVAPEFTRALTDPNVPVCDRTLSIPRAASSAFGPTDDFSANVLLGTYILQSEVCYDFLKEVMCAGGLPDAGVGVTAPASAAPTAPVSGNPPTIQCDSTKSLWPLAEGGRWDLWSMIPFGEKQWPAAAWSISVDQVPPGVPGTAVIGIHDDFSFIPESCDARWYVSEKPFGILMHGADAGVFCGGRVISPTPALLFPAPAASRPLKECAGWMVIDSNASVATPAGNFQGAIRYQAPFWTFGSNAVEMWLCPGVGPVGVYLPGQRVSLEPFVPVSEMDLPPLLLMKYY